MICDSGDSHGGCCDASDLDGRLVGFLVGIEALVDVGRGVAVLELAAQQ